MKFLTLFLFLVSMPALAQRATPQPVHYDEVTGAPVYLLKDLPPDWGTLVYNGTKAVKGELGEVGHKNNCTATVVSSRRDVVFTAGHCVSGTISRSSFTPFITGVKVPMTCYRHPSYTSAAYNDYALCILDQALPESVQYASFDIVAKPKIGAPVLMNGFGQPGGFGTLRWGKSQISRYRGDQDLVTCTSVNLGSGDSGGSLFAWLDDKSDATERDVHAPNSRGGGGCSYFNSVAVKSFIDYAKAFEEKHFKPLCGVSLDCKKPAEPLDCDALYDDLKMCMKSEEAPMPVEDESCAEKYTKFKGCLRE